MIETKSFSEVMHSKERFEQPTPVTYVALETLLLWLIT